MVAPIESFTLSEALFDQLVEFGRAHAPEECVGVGLGPEAGHVVEFHRLDNVHETPITRYEVSAADQLRLLQYAESNGWDFTLLFHTHPATEPYPSATDIALAMWPQAVYAILGLGALEPELRAFRIVDGLVSELPVVVEVSSAPPGQLRADDA